MTISFEPPQMCDCGTMLEAYEVALRQLAEARTGGKCMRWYISIAAAHLDILTVLSAHSDEAYRDIVLVNHVYDRVDDRTREEIDQRVKLAATATSGAPQ